VFVVVAWVLRFLHVVVVLNDCAVGGAHSMTFGWYQTSHPVAVPLPAAGVLPAHVWLPACPELPLKLPRNPQPDVADAPPSRVWMMQTLGLAPVSDRQDGRPSVTEVDVLAGGVLVPW